jgi:hypothetical protein
MEGDLEMSETGDNHWKWFSKYINMMHRHNKQLFELMQSQQAEMLDLVGPDQFEHGEKHGREDAQTT